MKFRNAVRGRTGAVGLAVTALVFAGGVGTAVAAGQIGSADIRDGAVHRVDLHQHAVSTDKLAPGVVHRMTHALEADGPYPGLTQLHQGANSTEKWVGDSGATLQMSWVRCAPGKRALGGGFGQWDYSPATVRNMQIVTSVPATIQKGTIVDTPIPGDGDQSIRPNGWLVEGFNNGTSDVSVRPWVVCAVMR